MYLKQFADTIKKLMKWVGINGIKLAEKSQLDPKTIQRLRTGKVTKPKLHTMIALTIGLDLPYNVSLEFIRIAGYSLNIEEKLNFYYDSFLWDGIDYDIYQCDEILKREGFSGFIKE